MWSLAMVVFSSLATLLASMVAIRAEIGTEDLVENDPCLDKEYPVTLAAVTPALSDTEFLLEVLRPRVDVIWSRPSLMLE